MKGGSPAQEVSDGNKISHWARDHSCNASAKNMAAFGPYAKTLPEAKLKMNGQIYLAKEISR